MTFPVVDVVGDSRDNTARGSGGDGPLQGLPRALRRGDSRVVLSAEDATTTRGGAHAAAHGCR